MHINVVYVAQNVVNTEIRLREHHLATLGKATHRDLGKLKSEIQEVEKRKLEANGNYWRIGEAVTLACSSLEDEGIASEMDLDAQIS